MSKQTFPTVTRFALAVACLLSGSVYLSFAAEKLMDGTPLPFYVYKAAKSPQNHYTPTGWMGDYGDLQFSDKFMPKEKDAHAVIRVGYVARGSHGANWAGIYWQNPANNWGNREGGYNLNGAKQMVFMARGEKGGEYVSEFKVGGIEGNYRDSGSASIGPITLTDKWQEYRIPLEGQELSSISGGFCVVMNREYNAKGAAVYLDNIRFE